MEQRMVFSIVSFEPFFFHPSQKISLYFDHNSVTLELPVWLLNWIKSHSLQNMILAWFSQFQF